MPPTLTFAFEVRAQVGPAIDVGEIGDGCRRRIVAIEGGTFAGPAMSGRILPGGTDWQIVHPDGFTELDSRYALETGDGAMVTVRNPGIRHAPPHIMTKLLAGEAVDPAAVYFRTTPRFETAAPAHRWLMRSIFVGMGERYPSEVVVRFWRLE